MATSKELCVGLLLLLISSVIAVRDINNLEERKKVDEEEGKVLQSPHINQVRANPATDPPENVKRTSDEEVPAPRYLTDMGNPKKPEHEHVAFPKEHTVNPVKNHDEEEKTLIFKTNYCNQKKVIGPCRAKKPRFHFNSETKQCELFYYGGCKGNKNNFLSKEECMKKCGLSEAV